MKKLIAGFMTALMALLPLVSAVELGNYPAFLENEDGVLDALVVVGGEAAISDVVGSVDIAVRLAEVGKASVSAACSGAASDIDGVRKDTIRLPSDQTGVGLGASATEFPSSGVLKAFHFSGLRDSKISWRSEDYDFHETVGMAGAEFRHDFADSKINGTETLVVNKGDFYYDYIFDEALNLGSASTLGTIANPEYTYPINIELMGMPFQIVGLATNQAKMLAGSVGTATGTSPVISGDYSVYSDLGANAGWARVIIKDSDDNTVGTETVSVGSTKDNAATGLTIQVTAVRALMDGTVVGADIVVGPTADGTTKTYDGSANVVSDTTNDRFPGTTDWGILVSIAAGSANITVNDYVRVVYRGPKLYVKAGETIEFPNDFGELGFEGWNTDLWSTVTIEPVSSYEATDIGSDTTIYSDLNGLKVSVGESGSIQAPDGDAYTEAYILLNTSLAAADSYLAMVGYYDDSKSKILVDPDATATAKYAAEVMTLANDELLTYNFTLNYGGVGDSTYRIWFTVGNPINGTVFRHFRIGTSIYADYQNTTLWTNQLIPEFRLGSTTSAQTADVRLISGGVNETVGTKTSEIVGDQGMLLQSPETNAGSQTVIVNMPAKDLKIQAYFGKLGAGVSGSEVTYDDYPSIPVTTAIARLDSEVTAADKGKNMVSVGGPAVNSVSADALGLEYPTKGVESTIPQDKALIKVVDSPYEEGDGMVIVVVAGWEAENTRAASSVLQNFGEKLDGVTASEVEVSGSVGSSTVTEA